MSDLRYISGPITKDKKAYYRFAAWKEAIEYFIGLRAINPFDIFRNEEDKIGITWLEYLKKDCGILIKDCGGAYFLPGWIWSKGARLEFIICLLFKIPRIIIKKSFIKKLNKEILAYNKNAEKLHRNKISFVW